MWDRASIPGMRKLTKAVKKEGALLIGQLNHGGRQHLGRAYPGMMVAPSEIACPRSGGIPHALTLKEVNETIEWFETSAMHCIEAGMHGVELHGAQGLDQRGQPDRLRDQSGCRAGVPLEKARRPDPSPAKGAGDRWRPRRHGSRTHRGRPGPRRDADRTRGRTLRPGPTRQPVAQQRGTGPRYPVPHAAAETDRRQGDPGKEAKLEDIQKFAPHEVVIATRAAAHSDRPVTFVSRYFEPFRELPAVTRISTLRELDKLGVEFVSNHEIARIENGAVVLRQFQSGPAS